MPVLYPKYFDYSKDHCTGLLREYELEAYASVLSAFRAQGELNNEKKNALKDLSNLFHIPVERHKAELRRAINDETLATISFQVCGDDFEDQWVKEGRKVVPSLVRPLPITKYTEIADEVAELIANENKTATHPSDSGNPENFSMPSVKLKPPDNPEKNEAREEVAKVLASAGKNICSSCKRIVGDCVEASTSMDLYPDHEYSWLNSGNKKRKRRHSFVYLPSGTIRVRSEEEVEDTETSVVKVEANFTDFTTTPEINLTGKPTKSKPRKKNTQPPPVVHSKDDVPTEAADTKSEATKQHRFVPRINIKNKFENEPKKPAPARPTQRYRRKVQTPSTRYQPMPVQNSPVPPEHLYGLPTSQRHRQQHGPDLFQDKPPSESAIYTPSPMPYSPKDGITEINTSRPRLSGDKQNEKVPAHEYAIHQRPRYTSPRVSPYSRPTGSLKGINVPRPSFTERAGRPFHIHKKDSSQFSAHIRRQQHPSEPLSTEQSHYLRNNLDNLATVSLLRSSITSSSQAPMDETGLAPVSAIVSRVSSPSPATLPAMKAHSISSMSADRDLKKAPEESNLQFKVIPMAEKDITVTTSSEIKLPKEFPTIKTSILSDEATKAPTGLSNIQISLAANRPRGQTVLKSASGNIITVTAKTQPIAKVTSSTAPSGGISRPLTGQSKPSIIVVRSSKPGAKLGKSTVGISKAVSDKTKLITIGKHLQGSATSVAENVQSSALGSIQGLVSGLVTSGSIVRVPTTTPKIITVPKRSLSSTPKVFQKTPSGKLVVKSPSIPMSALSSANRFRTLTAGQIIKPQGAQKTVKTISGEIVDSPRESGLSASIENSANDVKPIAKNSESFKPKLVFTTVGKSPVAKSQVKQIVVTSQGADVSFLTTTSIKNKPQSFLSYSQKSSMGPVSSYLTSSVSASRPVSTKPAQKTPTASLPSQMQVKVFKPVTTQASSAPTTLADVKINEPASESGSSSGSLIKQQMGASGDRTTFIYQYHITPSSSSTATTQSTPVSGEITLHSVPDASTDSTSKTS